MIFYRVNRSFKDLLFEAYFFLQIMKTFWWSIHTSINLQSLVLKNFFYNLLEIWWTIDNAFKLTIEQDNEDLADIEEIDVPEYQWIKNF